MKILDDVRVLDLTHFYNGPYAALVLGFFGAEVIKIEPPELGERARTIFPIPGVANESYPFVMLNSNKKGVTLNLKAPRGQELFKQLVQDADVVVENFTAGVMDRLGLGWDVLKQINPRLVYASSTGYGRSGPYSAYPAFDPIVQAMSGLMSATGAPDGPPTKAGTPIMDILGGIHFATGILVALRQRDRTGEGVFMETSLYESAIGPMASLIAAYLGQGETYERAGNSVPGHIFSPYNCYPTQDGYVLLLVLDDQRWQALCTLMDRQELSDDPKFATKAERSKRWEELDDIVSAWTKQHTKQDVMERCSTVGITCGTVKEVAELLSEPYLRTRGILQDISHPMAGTVPIPGPPWRFNGEQPSIDSPSPTLGQHNELVYGQLLDLSEEELTRLKEEGVV